MTASAPALSSISVVDEPEPGDEGGDDEADPEPVDWTRFRKDSDSVPPSQPAMAKGAGYVQNGHAESSKARAQRHLSSGSESVDGMIVGDKNNVLTNGHSRAVNGHANNVRTVVNGKPRPQKPRSSDGSTRMDIDGTIADNRSRVKQETAV